MSTYTDNDEMSVDVCEQLELKKNQGATEFELDIFWRGWRGGLGPCWSLPACIATYNIVNITATACLTVDTFAHFPTSLVTLTLMDARFDALPSKRSARAFTSPPSSPTCSDSASTLPFATARSLPTTLDGYNTDGTINWTELFEVLPNLHSLSFIRGNLQGGLPSGVPSELVKMVVTNQQLSGELPALLFQGLSPNTTEPLLIDFDFNGNQITGTLPSNLFGALSTLTIGSLRFNLAHNQLDGSLPPTWLSYFPSAQLSSLSLDLGFNDLNGNIPDGFFQQVTIVDGVTAPTLHFSICSNQLQGNIPDTLFTTLPPMFDLKFNASKNNLSGELRYPIVSYGWRAEANLVYDVSSNALTGAIPPGLIAGSLQQNVTFDVLSLVLRDNNFQGAIPFNLFRVDYTDNRDGMAIDTKRDASEAENVSSRLSSDSVSSGRDHSASSAIIFFAAAKQLTLDFSLNKRISGQVSPVLFNGVFADANAQLSLDISQTGLEGTFSSEFLLLAPPGMVTIVNASNNLISTPPVQCGLALLNLDISNNKITTSFLPSAWGDCPITQLRISGNPNLRGSIPSGFLTNTNLVVFQAANTGLRGDLPSYHPLLAEVDLSSTSISFCSPASLNNFGTFNAICNLGNTTACECRASYTGSCAAACNIVPLPPSPVPAPTGCPGRRPGPEFNCTGGIWIAPATDRPVLVIPPSSGPIIIISGNISSSQIFFTGIGSLISIGGCATNLTSIIVELTQEEAKEIGKLGRNQSLITLADALGCGMDLNNIDVAVKNEDGCRKVSSRKSVSDDNKTLGALFTVDSSGCRTWWIILVSVLGGVVVLAVIVIVLMAIFWPAFRLKLRPYSVKRGGDKAAV